MFFLHRLFLQRVPEADFFIRNKNFSREIEHDIHANMHDVQCWYARKFLYEHPDFELVMTEDYAALYQGMEVGERTYNGFVRIDAPTNISIGR